MSLTPCNNCPWRKDAPLNYWDAQHFHDIAATCRGDGMSTMLCHKSKPAEGIKKPCAGWVASQGLESIGVRVLAMEGKIPDDPKECAGGHDLYTFDEMLEANGINLKSEHDHVQDQINDLLNWAKSIEKK